MYPNAKSVLLRRGFAKSKVGKHEEAIKDFDVFLNLNPGSEYARLMRCRSSQALGKLEESIRDLDILWLQTKFENNV